MCRNRGYSRRLPSYLRSIRLALVLAAHFGASLALGAELHLREAILQAQRDRVTATFTATIDHIGDRAHSLGEDCDIHVPLRSRDLRVPVLGEVKNACSQKPAGSPLSFWSDQIYEETHGRAVPVTGVFRLWLEHPPAGGTVQTEAQRVPWYGNSNPDHQVELHPLTRIGDLDFHEHVKRIAANGNQFQGFGATQLESLVTKTLTIQRLTVNGESFVRLQGPKTGFNHWNLRARLTQAPIALGDGTRIRVDILKGNQVVPGALDLPAVSVAGTSADTKAQTLSSDAIIRFQALVRIDLATVLTTLSESPQSIPLPVEFVLLDVE